MSTGFPTATDWKAALELLRERLDPESADVAESGSYEFDFACLTEISEALDVIEAALEPMHEPEVR